MDFNVEMEEGKNGLHVKSTHISEKQGCRSFDKMSPS